MRRERQRGGRGGGGLGRVVKEAEARLWIAPPSALPNRVPELVRVMVSDPAVGPRASNIAAVAASDYV